MTRRDLVEEARRWIGTPYRHGASLRGVGCDCLGLIIGVRQALLPGAPEDRAPLYPPDWAEARGEERLMLALDHRFPRVPEGQERAGDLFLFRWRLDRPASHVAIASGDGAMIHAHAHASVAEVVLTPTWRRRLAAIFQIVESV